MEDLFESIVGAVYIDSREIAPVLKVVSRMLDVGSYFGEKAPKQSAKNALQEWCADKKHRLPPPVYKTVSESGPDHKKTFERACYIADKIYGTGVGKNQKLADAAAAEATLSALMAEEEAKLNPRLDPKLVMEKLKDAAKKNKKPGPEFRDLGETESSCDTMRCFSVECRFMGKSVCGKGTGKREAKEDAAEKMLKLLSLQKAKEDAKKAPMKKTVPSKRKFKKKITKN